MVVAKVDKSKGQFGLYANIAVHMEIMEVQKEITCVNCMCLKNDKPIDKPTYFDVLIGLDYLIWPIYPNFLLIQPRFTFDRPS